MHVAVIGAAGMIGRKLTDRMVADGRVGETAVDKLTLADVISPPAPAGWSGELQLATVDLSVAGGPEELLEGRPDVIFHLAAIVSGEAEKDFDKGYRVNLQGTWDLLEAIRAANAADGYPTAAGVHVIPRGVRCPVPEPHPGRLPRHAADQLWRSEGDG